MLRTADDILNEITMYRLLAYGLGLLAAVGLVFSATDIIGMPLAGLALSLVLLVAGCYGANRLLASVWQVPVNSESWLLTALIMFFVLPPATDLPQAMYVLLAGVVAMASKFLVTRQGAHIFNPAAFGVAAGSLTGLLPSAWWVGSSALWPFSLALGLLVVRKIRRTYMFVMFAAVAAAISIAAGLMHGVPLGQEVRFALLQSPLIFLGSIMLTEPATMPAFKRQQLIFATLVALLYALHWRLGPVKVTPELALLIGNAYAALSGVRGRTRLRLLRVERIGKTVANYVFRPERPLRYRPGQYLEWTLPISRGDARGNRRTFTVASSPSEPEIMLGVKFYDRPSRFKQALRAMEPGDTIYAGQVAGNFTLPADDKAKLAFIAGGIGITPFRSMVKSIIDNDERRDVVLVYLLSKADELLYDDIFAQAESHGVQTVKVLTGVTASPPGWQGVAGHADRQLLEASIPDFAARHFFVSGPNRMVQSVSGTLRRAGIPRRRIRTDHFSGY